MDISEVPPGLNWHPEWQRLVFDPEGKHMDTLDSGWYPDKQIADSLLNSEYPQASSTGFTFKLRARWVSEERIVID